MDPQQGDLVWAKLEGHPWWPALVCPGPQGSIVKATTKSKQIHVQFFSEPPTTAWIKEKSVGKFDGKDSPLCQPGAKYHSAKKTFAMALDSAQKALCVTIAERLPLIVTQEKVKKESVKRKKAIDDSGGQAKKRKTNLKTSIIKPSAAPASTTSSKPSTVPKPKLGPLSFISRGPLTIKSRNDLNADRIPQRWREVCVRLNRKDVPEGLQPHEVVFVNSAPSPVAKVSIEMPDDLVGDDDVNDFDSEDEYVDSDNDPVWKPGSVASTNSEEMSETANRSKPLVCKDRNLDMLLEKDVEWEHFFTKQELDKMTFHQQRRLKNITQNYKIMCSMGLPAIKPDFMTGPVYRAEVAKAEEGSDAHSGIVCVDSNFDEECAQYLERTEQAQENAVKRTVPHFLQTAKRNMEEKDDKMKKVKRIKVTKTTGEDKTECSLLERSQVSCMNLEPPKNDHLLYCEECKDEFEGDCPVHGPYNYIQDKEVMKGDPLRADHTLPDCLEIKTSKIVTAGVGVFTKEGLESRIMFGPYCGDIITGKQAVLKTRYCWQIYTESKPSHFVDAQNKAVSNWMRYVNCATTESDQNLVAFQYKGGIYYCTFKPVLPGEELLVWYGDECARELGLIRDKNLLFRPKYVNGKEIYQCVYCKIAFTSSVFCARHFRLKHGGDQKLTSYDLQVIDKWLRENDDAYLKPCSKHLKYTVEKMYMCEVCGYASNSSPYMKTHMKIHAGEKRYTCEVCGYSFNQSGNLNAHMMTHTGEKPYKCEVCGYACNRSWDLKRHMRIHTGGVWL